MVTNGRITGRAAIYRGHPRSVNSIGEYKDRTFDGPAKPSYPNGNFFEKVNNPAYRIKKGWYEELKRRYFRLSQKNIEDAIEKGIGEKFITELQTISENGGRGRLDEAFDNADLVTKILLYKKS